MSKKIIFVSGIHGVGKTTLITKLVSHFGNSISDESASSIITREKNKNWSQKKVEDIDINQAALERGIKKILASSNKPLLLDGHFCLLNKRNDIEKIDTQIFKFLSPQLIILLIDEPQNIKERINNRDSSSWDLDLITQFQQEEKQYAQKVSKLVNSELLMINPSEIPKAISRIENKYYA
jgi:adenylate kinase